MRVVFVGAGNLAVHAATIMRSRGHEVVIIEQNKERIDELDSVIDCGFIHGDGGKPAILREAGPTNTNYLFCLTGNDQTNIIASLVGRSLGYVHTITKINDAEFEHVCIELGLENTIVPSETIGRYLADMLQGESPLALSAMLRGDARVFSFIARPEDTVLVAELDLPRDCRVMFFYRGEKFIIAEDDTQLKEGDEVVVIARDTQLDDLRGRWSPA